MNKDGAVLNFMAYLTKHIERKKEFYDGANEKVKKLDTSYVLALCTEELGEIASALVRNRLHAARYECIDLAHTALLLFLAIESKLENENQTL